MLNVPQHLSFNFFGHYLIGDISMIRRSIYIGLLSFLLVSTSIAGPGYVSRDCPGAGTKESITVDWSFDGEWFYTQSWHLRKQSGSPPYKWEKHTSGNSWQHTWRSYAGQVGNWLKNYYYSGVYGVHYWYNTQARRVESRRKFVTSCNLSTWGYNNW